MHANDIFLFFKNYFWYQHIKTIQNVQSILNFNKKNSNFLGTQIEPRSQTSNRTSITLYNKKCGISRSRLKKKTEICENVQHDLH